MNLGNQAANGTVYLVRVLGEKDDYRSHRLFSSREKAEKHISDTPLPVGHKFSIIEREATAQSVAQLTRSDQ